MKTFCNHYLPNNPDYVLKGYCLLHQKDCEYKGQYPENTSINTDQQRQCPDFEEWQDPINSLTAHSLKRRPLNLTNNLIDWRIL